MNNIIAVLLVSSLAVPSFAVSPRNNRDTAAVVDGTKITAGDVAAEMWRRNGRAALENIINEKLLLAEAARQGVKADKKAGAELYNKFLSASSEAAVKKELAFAGWTSEDFKDYLRRQEIIRLLVVKEAGINITEEAVKQYYDANPASFTKPESVNLSQIFVNTKEEADDIMSSIKKGLDFHTLSSLKSDNEALKKNDGRLGRVSRGSGALGSSLEQIIFALGPGQHTNIIPTGKGYSVFMAEDYTPAVLLPYEEVKDRISAALFNTVYSQELNKIIKRLRSEAKIETE